MQLLTKKATSFIKHLDLRKKEGFAIHFFWIRLNQNANDNFLNNSNKLNSLKTKKKNRIKIPFKNKRFHFC